MDEKKLIPPFSSFEANGDRRDLAYNKSEYLKIILKESGDIKRAIKEGKINSNALTRYLSDPYFREKLEEIKEHLSGMLVGKAIERALEGSDRMLEYTLSALQPETFDSGFRRQLLANKGQLASQTLGKLLASIDPFGPLPHKSNKESEGDLPELTDKESYQSILPTK